MVSTSDSDSGNPSSIPGTTFFFCSALSYTQLPIPEACSRFLHKFDHVETTCPVKATSHFVCVERNTERPLRKTELLGFFATDFFPMVKWSKYCGGLVLPIE